MSSFFDSLNESPFSEILEGQGGTLFLSAIPLGSTDSPWIYDTNKKIWAQVGEYMESSEYEIKPRGFTAPDGTGVGVTFADFDPEARNPLCTTTSRVHFVGGGYDSELILWGLGSGIYIWYGENLARNLNRQMDRTTFVWSYKPRAPDPQRVGPGVFALNDDVYIMAGRTEAFEQYAGWGVFTYNTSMDKYSPTSEVWVRTGAVAVQCSQGMSASIGDIDSQLGIHGMGKTALHGNFDNPEDATWSNAYKIYNPSTDTAQFGGGLRDQVNHVRSTSGNTSHLAYFDDRFDVIPAQQLLYKYSHTDESRENVWNQITIPIELPGSWSAPGFSADVGGVLHILRVDTFNPPFHGHVTMSTETYVAKLEPFIAPAHSELGYPAYGAIEI